VVNYYKILDLENYASVDEVKSAYKAKLKIYHPDINKTPDAEEMTKYFNLAKSQLETQEKKTKYDRELKLAYLIEIKRLKEEPKKSYWDTLSRKERGDKLEENRKLNIKEKYDKSLEYLPRYIRVPGLIVILLWGLQIIFTHHFKEFGAEDYFYTILGYFTFATACIVAANEAYTYFLVKSLDHPIKFNYERKIGKYFVLGFIVSIAAVEGLNIFRGYYLLNNHFAYTTGIIDADNSRRGQIVVDYSVDGTRYKRALDNEDWNFVRVPGNKVVVKYAKDFPKISSLVNKKDRNLLPR